MKKIKGQFRMILKYQATSYKQQATSFKQQALDKTAL